MSRRVDQTKAVAYLRVSTDEQHLGPEAQRAAIEAWAKRRGVEVISWHEDRDVGGAEGVERRAGLTAALAALRASRARWLVAAKRDRVARDVELAALIDSKVRRLGALLITADGASDQQTTEGHLMARIVDVFAEHERRLIRSRTAQALAVKRARGERVSRFPPYGWTLVEGGALVLNEAERATLARIAQLAAEGRSLNKIAADLERSGHRSRAASGRWQKTTIARLVRRLETHAETK